MITDKTIEENKKATLNQFKEELVKHKKRLEEIEKEKQQMYCEIKKIKDNLFDYDIHNQEVEQLDYECKWLMEDLGGIF